MFRLGTVTKRTDAEFLSTNEALLVKIRVMPKIYLDF